MSCGTRIIDHPPAIHCRKCPPDAAAPAQYSHIDCTVKHPVLRLLVCGAGDQCAAPLRRVLSQCLDSIKVLFIQAAQQKICGARTRRFRLQRISRTQSHEHGRNGRLELASREVTSRVRMQLIVHDNSLKPLSRLLLN